jgi:hypothetical protein
MRKILLLSLCFAFACTQSTDAKPQLAAGPTEMALPFDHPPITGSGGDAAGGVPATPDFVMGTRRLSVAQLKASLPVVLGGSTWKTNSTTVGFDSRAAALGQPDYVSITEENLEPSPLYLKFMADAARVACTDVMTADAALAQNARVMTRFVSLTDTTTTKPGDVNANLRYLKLRFHGIKVQPADDAAIADARKLFSSVVSGAAGTATVTAAHVREGWKAVCIALLTAPEYHLY